jgi:diguanylate cyclase (GGDEF)-like protein/PAS domain S-box-containing protein
MKTQTTARTLPQSQREIWPTSTSSGGHEIADSAILAVFENTSFAIIISDNKGRIVAVNPAFEQITGWLAAEVVGQKPSILSSGRQNREFYAGMWRTIADEGHWEGEIWNRRKSGTTYPEWLTIDVVLSADGDVVNYIGMFSDITERRREQQKLERLAFHDPLTGLANRALFNDRLDNAIERAKRDDGRLAVVAIDVDNFKLVNDSHGHGTGDDLLVAMANRASRALRASDTIARVGGDEFLALIPAIEYDDDPVVVARKLLSTLSQPYRLSGIRLKAGASLGVSIFPNHGTDRAALIEAADHAMYRAKNDGKGAICISLRVT